VFVLKRVWRFLRRMGVASFLLLLLLLFSLLGSFLPQLPSSVTNDPERLSAWLTAAQERWGPAVDNLYRLGVFTLFRSPLFAVLLGLAALSTLACTLGRWRGAFRRVFRRPVRCPDTLFEPGPCAVTLPPASTTDLQAALGGKGYRVRVVPEGEVTHLRADRYGLSDLATLLTHLAILLVLAGYGLTGWLGWRVEMEVGPGEVVHLGHGTGLAVRNDGFAIDHYPDGSVADYRAQVTFLDGDRVVVRETVRVNGPLRFRGLGVYLMGFREAEDGTGLVLQVSRDPGAVVALAGGLLLVMGVTVTIYLPHRRIYARLERERTLLAVRSSGRDDDPGAELAALAREFGGC